MIRLTIILISLLSGRCVLAQSAELRGRVMCGRQPVPFAHVGLIREGAGALADSSGYFMFESHSTSDDTLLVISIGYEPLRTPVKLASMKNDLGVVQLVEIDLMASEIVVSGSLHAVSRLESIVPVEVYSRGFLEKNPVCNVFESLQQMNGVRPQVNCNICSTGDIHINGMEGPYTMLLIDGMPIVSSLSTVYGFSGIPTSMIDRVEVVKGPAGALYGSEAMGGLINIITRPVSGAPKISLDAMSSSWLEHSVDVSASYKAGKNISMLSSASIYFFDERIDKNNDNFTDIPTQKRISWFQKINLSRPHAKLFSIAARYLYEDRFGGEMQWKPEHRGGSVVYGESIYTSRSELISQYELPFQEKMIASFSLTDHRQNSVYGNTKFLARQTIGFGQLTHYKKIGKHHFLSGLVSRYTFYDDNTAATAFESTARSDYNPHQWLHGIFFQDELHWNAKHQTLGGLRLEYHHLHGEIFTPRIGHRWQLNNRQLLRLNAGKGFRVVNIFTEDHAALTGARDVVISESLRPETSVSANLNYHNQIARETSANLSMDASIFYTRFGNRIVADYTTDANKILYNNITGYASAIGSSVNFEGTFGKNISAMAGAIWMDNKIFDQGEIRRPLLTERFSAVWSLTLALGKLPLIIDYTGSLYSPMELPLAGPLDPRNTWSPWWSIQNIQLKWRIKNGPELYAGVKNILDRTPAEDAPFLIARSFDPFDRQVQFDESGDPISTANNPLALTFDPTYVFAPNQGVRFFLGVRWEISGSTFAGSR
jgi:outer membrane receptor for ferrienterochelin and colicins